MFVNKKKWNIKIVTDKKKKKIPIRFWIYLSLLVLCAVGLIYVSRLPQYQVRNVSVSGTLLTREADIMSIAREYLSYNYFYFVPQSNIWLYPKNKILERIRLLSSVEDVEMDLNKASNELNINIKERKHEYVWCDEVNICYYMDKNGYVFAGAPTFEGNVFLTFKGQIQDTPLGKYFLPQEKMLELLEFIENLKNIGFSINTINMLSDREVRLILDSKTEIIVSMEKSLHDCFRNIETLVNSADFQNVSGGIEKVQYIDMRYGKKAFWK